MICTEEDFIRSDKLSFGSDIGSITNKSTALFDILALFEPNSDDYNEVMYRIICSIGYSQNAIDRSKGIISDPFPVEWYRFKPNVIEEDDDEETIERKLRNQRLLVHRAPYFFNYNYDFRRKEYKTYMDQAKRKAILTFGISLDDLLEKEKQHDLTDEMKEFLHFYRLQIPCTQNQCVMNKICWRIEEEFDGWVGKKNKTVPFDHRILQSGNEWSPTTYQKVKHLYDLYVRMVERSKTIHKTFKKQTNEENQMEMLRLKENFKNEAYRICSNEQELADILIEFCYSKGGSKRFAWDLCGEQIVKNLLNKNNQQYQIPVLSENPTFEFRGMGFEMLTVQHQEEEV